MHRPSFSLSSILLLTVIAAVYLAAISPTVTQTPDIAKDCLAPTAGVAILSLPAGLFWGIVSARAWFFSWRSVVLGAIAGFVAAMATAVFLAAARSPLTVLVGAPLVVAVSFALRTLSDRAEQRKFPEAD